VESATPEDKTTLVKWMFAAMSLHPDVAGMSAISGEQREAINRQMADLAVNLIAVRCRDQAKQAVKLKGEVALQESFTVLGKVAGQEIFSDPNVTQGLGDIQQFIDSESLNVLLGIR